MHTKSTSPLNNAMSGRTRPWLRPQHIGILASFGCSLTWVIGALFLSRMYQVPGLQEIQSPSLPLAVAFLYGGGGVLCALVFLAITGRLAEIPRTMGLRASKYLWMGGAMGGPVAMGFFCLALQNLDPAYVMPVTSAYPALCALLAVLFLREKINGRAWMGIMICICGAIIIGFTPPASESAHNFYTGIFCAVGVAVAWSLEAVLTSKGVDFVDPFIATSFRYLSYLILCPIFILPLLGGFEYILPVLRHAWVPLAVASVCSFTNCLFYYLGISLIGSARAATITSSYSIFSILAGLLLASVHITGLLVGGGCILFMGLVIISWSSRNDSFRMRDEANSVEVCPEEPRTAQRTRNSMLPLKAGIANLLHTDRPTSLGEVCSAAQAIYGKEGQCREKIIHGHLQAMHMAGLVEVRQTPQTGFILTRDGLKKLNALLSSWHVSNIVR